MTSATSKIFYSLLILSSHFYSSISFGTYGFEVHVINGLPDSLIIHCASKDDDFGFKRLNVQENFHWYFHRNIWLTTMYFCHFWWSSKSVSFEVFNYTISEDCRFDQLNIDRNRCVWLVQKDGFYFGNQYPLQNIQKIHDW